MLELYIYIYGITMYYMVMPQFNWIHLDLWYIWNNLFTQLTYNIGAPACKMM